ncbi:tyrosine-type recombinase/integrase [Aureimonas leprariae]|uniref:DUF4102 domain-containing protein n=1 Tax=Plantimonas leprariae TaxID=2615207 RepID=A0A7V7TWX9_9HYPH|nr:integrase arm-type DNA-binding domain-containing protein [Aureimonas leprariae]KAB0680065.1 DUF4102 domain-containing protein [Aureimonas leprariae]
MRSANKLSALAVTKATKPGLYGDGHGLYLQIAIGGSKSWLFRFQRDGRARKMGLGPIHTVSLAMAREKALECRRKLLDGIDPIDQRQEAEQERKLAKLKGMSFREAAERYIAANKAGWKNAKHAAQWTATLEAYAFPVFGTIDVAAVDVGLVLKVLEPIWTTKAETASRVRGRIESVLDWATARKYRQGENPARWKGHLDHILPARSKVQKVKHHAALPYAEVAGFVSELRQADGIGARALEFAILTAGRTGEVVGARWDEFDIEAKLWIVPAERMKASRQHRVPLSDSALAILDALPREKDNPHVFIGDRRGRPLSNMALLMTLRRMERGEITAHGFRSTFRDWAAETTAYPSDMVEMALAHTVGNKVEAAYRRGDLFEKRRRLMADWATYCGRPTPAGEVVKLRGKADA